MTSSEPNRLPQLAVLPEIVRNLYDLPPVKAVFLGGSFGRGEGDLWSDLDLQVLVDEEFADFLDDAEIRLVTGKPPVALERFKLGPTGWMHHMILADGIIVDLFCRTELSVAETRMWIALSANMASLPEAIATHPKPWSPVSIAQGGSERSGYALLGHDAQASAGYGTHSGFGDLDRDPSFSGPAGASGVHWPDWSGLR